MNDMRKYTMEIEYKEGNDPERTIWGLDVIPYHKIRNEVYDTLIGEEVDDMIDAYVKQMIDAKYESVELYERFGTVEVDRSAIMERYELTKWYDERSRIIGDLADVMFTDALRLGVSSKRVGIYGLTLILREESRH